MQPTVETEHCDPYLIDRPALIAFSGGRTSGFMLRNIIDAFGGTLPDDVIPTFCNTGLEHPKTLDFVQECGERWGVAIRWLEYRGEKTFEIVNHATASRKGEPFTILVEERKYLPNPVTRFCTVEMKIRTMDRYADTLGWDDGHTECVGLRADEPWRVARIKTNHRRNEVCCPIHAAKHTLADVTAFWAMQDFQLEIPQHQGNCQGCFLKSKYRLEQVARETPEAFEWWMDQEEKVRTWAKDGLAKSFRFRNDRPSYRIQLQMSKNPTLFCGLPSDDDTMPCDCTD